jgi:hypothetical protein
MQVYIQAVTGGFPGGFLASDLSATDTAAAPADFSLYFYNPTSNTVAFGASVQAMTNTLSQIRTRFEKSDATTYLGINTLGWIDRRGRDG